MSVRPRWRIAGELRQRSSMLFVVGEKWHLALVQRPLPKSIHPSSLRDFWTPAQSFQEAMRCLPDQASSISRCKTAGRKRTRWSLDAPASCRYSITRTPPKIVHRLTEILGSDRRTHAPFLRTAQRLQNEQRIGSAIQFRYDRSREIR